jgi:ABC-type proline/glycine betaine transport system substrate-binding protein
MAKSFCTVFAVAVALFLLAASAEAQQAYEGQISGTFNGWTGETIYKLMDGHIIQQSEYHYHYHYAYAPKVIIYQSAGGYKIHVEDDDDQDVGIRVLR